MDTKKNVCERHAGEQYRDHERNMMMKAGLDFIEKQKAFRGAAAKDFARAFQKQTVKISEALNERVERQTDVTSATSTFIQRTKPVQVSK